MSRIPILILGGTGYVAGEALRLVLGHPQLEIAGILSDSQPGERLATAFPHLAPALGDLRFVSEAEIMTLVATLPLRGATRGQRRADRPPAQCRRGGRHPAAGRRHLCGLPLSDR